MSEDFKDSWYVLRSWFLIGLYHFTVRYDLAHGGVIFDLCGRKRILCSSFSRGDIYFTYFLLWSRSQVPYKKGGEKRGKRRGLLWLEFSEMEIFLFPLLGSGREGEELLQSLECPFMFLLLLRAESFPNCVLWNLEYSYSQDISCMPEIYKSAS